MYPDEMITLQVLYYLGPLLLFWIIDSACNKNSTMNTLSDTFMFFFKYKQCVPEATKYFRDKYRARTVCVRILLHGRIWISDRPEFANKVFQSRKCLHRLGDPEGLRKLGMFHQGIIWNNDSTKWAKLRGLFQKAVLNPGSLEEAVQISRKAFEFTLHEILVGSAPGYASGSNNTMIVNINVLDFFRLCTFRITAALSLGMPVDSIPHQEALKIVRTIGSYFKAWDYYLLLPPLVHMLRGWDGGQYKSHDRAIEDYRITADAIIERARLAHPLSGHSSSMGNDNGRFLRELLEMEEQGDIRHSEVQQMVMEMLLAGTDTSSVTMTWVALAWQQKPDLEQKAICEIQARGNGLDTWTRGDIKELILLGACTDESMRRKPVGPVIIRKATEDETICIKGARIPQETCTYQLLKGDSVVIDLASMGLQQDTFPDPQAFCPTRNFLENALFKDSTNAACALRGTRPSSANEARFMPFGHGAKMCVGYSLADVEMKMLLACWVATFRSTGTKPGILLEDIETKWEIANHPMHVIMSEMYLRHPSRVYLIGPHGSGKTTLMGGLEENCKEEGQRQKHWRITFRSEVAREVMRGMGITVTDMSDSVVYQKLQLAVIRRQHEIEITSCDESTILTTNIIDRCGLDSLAYICFKFGMDSDELKEALELKEMQWLLDNRYRRPDTLILLVPPFSGATSVDDGVRMVSDAEGLARFCLAMRQVLQRVGVPFTELKALERSERVSEAWRLIYPNDMRED